MRVLIIDDSRSVQKSVSWRIQKMGFEVAGVGSDGREGVAQFQKLKPDLVLLDITMPNMDGRECLKRILEQDAQAKVIMLSALGSPEIVDECLTAGALSFIDKNQMMTKDYLERRIGEIVETLQARAA